MNYRQIQYDKIQGWNIRETGRRNPLAVMFLTDQICFSYFCRGSPSDYFYQIILNSDHRSQSRRSSKFCFHNKPRLLAVMFLTNQNFLAIFKEGHGPSDHFGQAILNSGHWFQRRFLKFSHRYLMEIGHVPWWPCFLGGHPGTISIKLF